MAFRNFLPIFYYQLINHNNLSLNKVSFCLNLRMMTLNRNYTSVKKEVVRLLDEKGKILGLKSREEVNKYAHKHNMILKNIPFTAKSKYLEMMAIPRSSLVNEQDEDEKSFNFLHTNQRPTSLEVKKFTFSHSIQDNDLEVKIKAIKKHIKKNCEVRILVTGSVGKLEILEKIFQKFHQNLENEARLLQKQMNNNNLKFVILPNKNVNKVEVKKSDESMKDFQPVSSQDLFEEGEFEQMMKEKLKK